VRRPLKMRTIGGAGKHPSLLQSIQKRRALAANAASAPKERAEREGQLFSNFK